ncbi:MAG: DUF1016 N-terminal domain-containing protein, partial [bacterium]|nr:DUF1016 N-terminal domain-containing protein [bacterium]
LTKEFGQGFSETQIKSFRKFYLTFSDLQIQQTMPAEFKSRLRQIRQTMPAESVTDGIALPVQLSWSHYERLIRIADPEARIWYMQEAATQQWDYRTLKRNIDSQYYYRLNQTPEVKRQEVVDEMHRLTADYENEKSTFVKNPMLVEFLGLSHREAFTESKLEQAILDHLEHFFEEKAFYDILIHLRDKNNFEYGEDREVDGIVVNDKCKSLACKIRDIIDAKSSFADWLNNPRVRDQLKQDIKICLVKNGYPPRYTPEVFREVMEQVENFKENEGVDDHIPTYVPIEEERTRMMKAADENFIYAHNNSKQ